MSINKLNYTGSSKILKNIVNAINSLIDGGGGGGSTVTYTPTLTSGTKTGEISIDGSDIDMYAPTPTSVTVTPILSTGTKIAEIDVNGSSQDIYAPNGGGSGNVNDVLVNGVSVVDGSGDAQIVSYKEVTQAEYDALPSSKFTDGIAYYIKDGTPSSLITSLNADLLWSGDFTGSGTISVPRLSDYSVIAIQNDVSVLMFGNGFTGVGSLGQYNSNSAYRFSYRFDTSVPNELTVNANNRGIIRDGNNLSTYGNGEWCKIKFIYGLVRKPTKGGHSYSLAEQIVGTWIDGKPVYEITIPFSNVTTNANTWKSIDISASLNNPKIVFVISDMTYYLVSGVERLFSDITYESPNILIKTDAARTNISGHFVIRYTKTTD